MSLSAEDGARYERWRSQWLVGTDSQSIATLRWHGLAAALALTAPLRLPAAPESDAGRPVAAPSPAGALAEAARQIRHLAHPGCGVRANLGEPRHA